MSIHTRLKRLERVLAVPCGDHDATRRRVIFVLSNDRASELASTLGDRLAAAGATVPENEWRAWPEAVELHSLLDAWETSGCPLPPHLDF